MKKDNLTENQQVIFSCWDEAYCLLKQGIVIHEPLEEPQQSEKEEFEQKDQKQGELVSKSGTLPDELSRAQLGCRVKQEV